MKRLIALPALLVLMSSSAAWGDDPDPEHLIGKWETVEKAAQLPAGTVFEFQKDGKLIVTADVAKSTKKGAESAKKSVDFKWSLKKTTMTFELPMGKADTTEVTKLTKTELEFKDANGTIAKFKRHEAPKAKEPEKDKEKDKEKP